MFAKITQEYQRTRMEKSEAVQSSNSRRDPASIMNWIQKTGCYVLQKPVMQARSEDDL